MLLHLYINMAIGNIYHILKIFYNLADVTFGINGFLLD